MNEKKHRIALLTAALGLWLIALPLTFEYRGHPIEISDIFCGFLFIVLGLLARRGYGLVGQWVLWAFGYKLPRFCFGRRAL